MCSFFCPQRPDPQLETNIPDAAIGWSSFWKFWTSLFGTFLHNSRHMCVSVVDAIESENVLHVYCWVQTFFDDRLRPGRNGFSSLTKKKERKKLTKGVWSTIERTDFFFVCINFFIIPSGNNIYLIFPIASILVRDRYREDAIARSRLGSPFFLSRQVCVCVCVCVTIQSIRSSHITFTPFISIYGTIWLEVLCVCVSNLQKKSFERNAVRVYCSLRGLNFRVSTKCILYFTNVYCFQCYRRIFEESIQCERSDFRLTYTIRYSLRDSPLETNLK